MVAPSKGGTQEKQNSTPLDAEFLLGLLDKKRQIQKCHNH